MRPSRSRAQATNSDAIDGLSELAAAATLVGAAELGWRADPGRRVDPPAVDGAVQIACGWAMERLGGPTLPMGAAEFRLFRPGPLDGPARCIVRGRHVGAVHALCDVAVIDDAGVRSELIGLSMVRRPS